MRSTRSSMVVVIVVIMTSCMAKSVARAIAAPCCARGDVDYLFLAVHTPAGICYAETSRNWVDQSGSLDSSAAFAGGQSGALPTPGYMALYLPE